MTETGPWTGSAWWADLARAVPLAGEAAGSEVRAATDAGLETELMTDGFVMDLVASELLGRVRDGDPAAQEAMIALGAELEARSAAGADVVDDAGEADELESVVGAYLTHVPSPGEPHGEIADALGPLLRAALDKDRDYRNEPTVAAFLDRLLRAVPALAPLAQEQRYGYHGEVLAHPFLGDVVQREVALLTGGASLGIDDEWPEEDRAEALRLYTSTDPDPSAEVRAVLALLEAELGSDPEVDDLIAVGLVEMLPYEDEPGAEIVTLLGPGLRAELDRQRAA